MALVPWRKTSSRDVLSLIERERATFGLSRVVDITSLDITGIPVYLCIRPRGALFTVSAGKGITHLDSLVSAAMESIEIDVAERLNHDFATHSSYNQLPLKKRIPFHLLPAISTSAISMDSPFDWVTSKTIDNKFSFFLPHSFVSLNSKVINNSLAPFAWGTNGLASSVNRDEAILSGIYEVVERDTIFCWSNYVNSNPNVHLYTIDLDTIPYESSANLIHKIQTSGLKLFLIQLRNELNLPVFKCHILNDIDPARYSASGYGCHHVTEIAINRAITEAIQGRTCFISGSREDILNRKFSNNNFTNAYRYFSGMTKESLHHEPFDFISTENALYSIQSRFKDLNWHPPVVFTYPNSGPFSVVKVFCPSLMPVSFSGMTISHPRTQYFSPPRTSFQLFCESLF